MRTSYLRPSSNLRRMYQDSRPRAADLVGNLTDTCVANIGKLAGSRVSRRRSVKPGWTSGRGSGLGPRNIVFSTLAFTVQAYVTMQSSQTRARIFGGHEGQLGEWMTTEDSAFFEEASSGPIGQSGQRAIRVCRLGDGRWRAWWGGAPGSHIRATASGRARTTTLFTFMETKSSITPPSTLYHRSRLRHHHPAGQIIV